MVVMGIVDRGARPGTKWVVTHEIGHRSRPRGSQSCHRVVSGRKLVVIEPVSMENLRARNGKGGGKSLVAIDELGAAVGQMVAFTEGREASNPFWPDSAPVDAYAP